MKKIGVVLGCKPSNFAKDTHYAMEIRYFTAVEKAGAIAVPITYSNIQQQLKNIDGILLPGGDFSTPSNYYIENQENGYEDNGAWFNAYMAIGDYALKNDIPLLGICGGMQILGILLGGKLGLIGHEGHRETNNKKLSHSIKIKNDTHLHKIIKKDEAIINSIHREYVAQLDDSLVTAKSDDGIIEAIESSEHKFVLGVQWHPECLVDDKSVPESLEVFKYFINKC